MKDSDWKDNDCIETNEIKEDDQEQEPRRSKISKNCSSHRQIKIRDKIKDEQGVPTVE